jgi:cullin-associated NEDD8-dissociated protein 1
LPEEKMLSSNAFSYVIAGLLEKMNSSDSDFRYMAINDLMSELQRPMSTGASGGAGGPLFDPTIEKKVVSALLKLIQDKNGEVSSLAVKWCVVSGNGRGGEWGRRGRERD